MLRMVFNLHASICAGGVDTGRRQDLRVVFTAALGEASLQSRSCRSSSTLI